jgi:hypothetical protein
VQQNDGRSPISESVEDRIAGMASSAYTACIFCYLSAFCCSNPA